MDCHTPEQRHYNMSQIHDKDTKPEVLVRKYLFSKGLRYRKNDKKLPGHPDIVLPKYKTVVFVNGCFWHGHDGCKYFVMPKSNTDFWKTKIDKNIARDQLEYSRLRESGWRIVVVWECELRSKNIKVLEQVYNTITHQCTQNL